MHNPSPLWEGHQRTKPRGQAVPAEPSPFTTAREMAIKNDEAPEQRDTCAYKTPERFRRASITSRSTLRHRKSAASSHLLFFLTVQLTHLPSTHNILTRLPLDLGDANRTLTPTINHLSYQSNRTPIIFKINWTGTLNTVQQSANMPNDTR